MITKLQKLKWNLHNYKLNQLMLWGLDNGYIFPYDEELIGKLRNIYYGGIPASLLLLSNSMSNGHCYDRALLMSRAFLDEEDDVQLVYATIDSLKLNPYITDKDNPLYADHCVVERITKNDKHLIYDTTSGFVYNKKIYWLMEHPKIRKICKKSSIIEFVKSDKYYYPENIERDKYATTLILPMIEMTYGSPTEMYSHLGIELLQREVEYFKKVINFDDVWKEIDDDIKKLKLRR